MHATFAELYIYIQFLLHDFSLLRSLSLRLPIRENKTDTFLKRYFYFSSEQNWSTQVKGKSVIFFRSISHSFCAFTYYSTQAQGQVYLLLECFGFES